MNVMCSLVNEKHVASIPEDNVAGLSEISVPIHTLHNVIFKKTLTFNVVNVTNKTKHNDRFDILTVTLMKTQIFLEYSDSEDEGNLLLCNIGNYSRSIIPDELILEHNKIIYTHTKTVVQSASL
jgi:hypothetical protein